MNFTLYTYRVKDIKWDFSQSETYYDISFYGMLISLLIVFLDFKIFKTEFLTDFFLIICSIFIFVILFSKIWRFSPEYQQKILSNKGVLQITEESFIFKYQDKIPFSEIEELEFSFYDYYGKSINMMLESGPTKSIGVENVLKLKTKNYEHFSNFELTSKAQSLLLEKEFVRLIFLKMFPRVDPKILMSFVPLEVRKKEVSRNYVAQNIKERKLNLTVGLLMMNYSTDKEAKELRKKYNL